MQGGINSLLLYEGKAKKVFKYTEDTVMMFFKDDATAGNRAKEAVFEGKGKLNASISAKLFEHLHTFGIDTHFIKTNGEYEHECYKLDIIPIEVIVRNRAAGTFCKRYGVEVGTALKNVIVEWCVKDDALQDPPICDDAIVALGITDIITLNSMRETSIKINSILTHLFRRVGLKLVDFKLEFGLDKEGKLLLADEICPDTMRLWNDQNESFDKDLFRNDSGDLLAGYRKVEELLINTL
tara:strand:+ start:398 stop:1114 length:717 start_codon:yes stop_codon:yes gene_type:complete